MPVGPAVAVKDLGLSTDPGLQEIILGAREVPDGIPDRVLTGSRTGQPFCLGQISGDGVKHSVEIGELFLQIGCEVHGYPLYRHTCTWC